VVRLAQPGADRPALLAQAGLDEARWEEVDDAWQTKLSEEEASGPAPEDGGDPVPPIVRAFDAAMARAQKASARTAPVPFARFALALREMQRHADTAEALRRAGMTMGEFLAANQYWTKEVVSDPELEAELRRILE
jgi:hypothetical protein